MRPSFGARVVWVAGLLAMAAPFPAAAQSIAVPVRPEPPEPRPIPRPPIRICRPPVSESLNVALVSQQTSMWCWAASAQMVMAYFGTNMAQCTQANNRFGRSDCCNNPTPGTCVQGGWPEFDKYGFTFSTTSDAPLSWATLRAEIGRAGALSSCRHRPFAFSWHWPGGGGHMMVARGYRSVGGTNFVQINNPWAPGVGDTRYIAYDWYVAGADDHTHWNDYYKIAKK